MSALETAVDIIRRTPPASVPCNGCFLCCQTESKVVVLPEEDASQYEVNYEGSVPFLKKQANGDCYYLDREVGCTIQDRKPRMCKVYDCAGVLKAYGWHEAKKHISKKVMRRAKELLDSGHIPVLWVI